MCQANETRLRFCAPDAFSGPLQKGMMMSRELLSSRDVTTHVTSQLTWHHVFHAVTHISPQLEGKFSSVNAFSRTHLTSSIQVTELDMPLDCGYLWFMWSDSNNEGYNRQVGGSIERRVPSWSHLDTLIERRVPSWSHLDTLDWTCGFYKAWKMVFVRVWNKAF